MNHPERSLAKALIYITYKNGVLDPQGQAVKGALASLGFEGVGDVRVGKYIEIELSDSPPEDMEARAEKMCRDLLANPVIEDFRIELPGAPDAPVAPDER
ncbi:MAG: phosphoribosylformylglycinamidine synthase [Nitrospinae bacterium]|nr:phosphoribosylformylglycinamidine synthase [Nitrospinota bacterium]